ncbi:aminotransferase class I/II-fold pyridoxal phosphate-dependent enzyme [Palleronia sediminis]|uniref:histidinol-phosphate transaminase n=1 Tax=Palleronia sediminis TaxID=2547833 RepID=A0A4R6AAZ5_9RHOB|nr:aminotransferase class I/II-fold pyridoxal phosphate-dependent enzyme [Palleronia sediminis]TDL78446.1 aminotransferase class I/II-fold pyridoxal phosphate-dependent enzyme [Palleronia sediminis]
MTTTLPHDLIRKDVRDLPDYNAGLALDRFREAYGMDCVAKLDSNESPLGPSPRAIEAMRKAAEGVSRYPDATNAALRAAIARHTGAETDRIIVGNGSEDLIGALFRAVIRLGDHVVTICPSFGLHEFGALTFGARVTKLPFEAEWSFPVEAMTAELRNAPRVLIFSSPSNPAGPVIGKDAFRAIVNAADPATLICFDEAYVEFIEPRLRFDALEILGASGKPHIVLRTFSKAYGLAGARVGYGITSTAEMTKALMKTRNPFGVNAMAAAGAIEALADTAHLDRVLHDAMAERKRVAAVLTEKGYPCAPSQTNFLFFDTGKAAQEFAEDLRRRGVLIKAWQEAPFTSWARVTMGIRAENDAFLGAVPDRSDKVA